MTVSLVDILATLQKPEDRCKVSPLPGDYLQTLRFVYDEGYHPRPAFREKGAVRIRRKNLRIFALPIWWQQMEHILRREKTDSKASSRKLPNQKPAVSPAAAPQASSAGLRNQMVKLLKGRDLTFVSPKTIRGELETSLSLPAGALDGQREEIMGIVADLLQAGTCTVEVQRASAGI